MQKFSDSKSTSLLVYVTCVSHNGWKGLRLCKCEPLIGDTHRQCVVTGQGNFQKLQIHQLVWYVVVRYFQTALVTFCFTAVIYLVRPFLEQTERQQIEVSLIDRPQQWYLSERGWEESCIQYYTDMYININTHCRNINARCTFSG